MFVLMIVKTDVGWVMCGCILRWLGVCQDDVCVCFKVRCARVSR